MRNKHKQSHRQYRKQVLRDIKAHLKYLSELHEEYVPVPADKAGNNVLVVCKKYYLDVVGWLNVPLDTLMTYLRLITPALSEKYLTYTYIYNIYPPQLQLEKTTEAPDGLPYLENCLQIQRGKFKTSVYDKRDAFKFHIVNFQFLDSNIPTKPAYGVYISQLVRIGRICDDFRERHRILTTRLLKQGYKYDQLCSYFRRF